VKKPVWKRVMPEYLRSCCRAILFVGPAHHDPERIVRQRTSWRAHPNVAPHRSSGSPALP